MVANLESGIRWVKERAEDYQIDPHHLGLMGASAGGHLACLSAVRVFCLFDCAVVGPLPVPRSASRPSS